MSDCGCGCESVISKRGERGPIGLTGATGAAGANGVDGNLLPMSTVSYEETNTLIPDIGDNEMFANISIATAGTYLAIFEADVNNDGNNASFRFDYSFMKNDVFTPLGGTRLCWMMNEGLVTKIFLSEFIVLLNTDTLNVNCDVALIDPGHSILSRSVKLLKIA